MNIQQYFEKQNRGLLDDKEWEELASYLLQIKFDREKEQLWAQKLESNGVRRSPLQARKRLHPVKLIGIAATLLLLFVSTWYFFVRMPLSNSQQLAAHYLEQPFRINQGNTRGSESVELNRGKAFETYETGQYEKSLGYLENIVSSGQAKAGDYFQIGLCLMYQKSPDYKAAINAFNMATQIDPEAYTDEIHWYSGLCYMMLKNNNAAIQQLELVEKSASSRNREAATELLGKLSK